MLLNYPCPAMIKIRIPRTLLLSLFSLLALNGFSNNIQVSNVALLGRNTSAGTNNAANFTQVQFNLSWENSWRVSVGPSNWDAAWVFVKFQVGASNPVLNSVNSSGTTITVGTTANLRVGMPVRVTSGTGAFASNTVISSITSATQFVVSATPTNVLINASIECTRIWEHATISTTAANHNAPTGSTIAPASDGTGAFIYRSAEGTGTFSLNAVQLRWNYGTNGVRDDALINLQVFGIEMVYVPQGDFNVGGGGGSSAFTSTTINTATATTAPTGTGSLGGAAGGYPTGQTPPASASWSNGYNAFYCMKYEVSQGQYRDFLNTLSYMQQVLRTASSPASAVGTGALSSTNANRNGIDISTPGNAASNAAAIYGCNLNGNASFNEANDGEWIACNYLTWMDGAAFADWAALRPMTEMEFEKACRGTQAAVSGEYAWGDATIAGSAYTLGSSGTITENITTNYSSTAGNTSYNTTDGTIDGPIRVGIFATAASSRRMAGATYYGIMEMSGNLDERTVSIGNTEGRAFTGLHGDGTLSINGHANTGNWPGLANSEVTAFVGTGLRGGGFLSSFANLIVSDRSNATQTSNEESRTATYGFRAVRTAQ